MLEKKLNKGSDNTSVKARLLTKPVTEVERKVTHLIRRMNRQGQWQNIGTLDYVPLLWFGWESFLKANYGPGRYNVAKVEKGLSGMQDVGTFNIAYDHEFVEWVPEKPTTEYIQERNIYGDLMIAKLTDVTYTYTERVNPETEERVKDQLEQGIQGFQGGWVIIRIKGLPY